MPTLYASIIRLHALHPGALTHDSGQWANAAFYNLIGQVDPDLATALHGWNGRKPFTISGLNGLPHAHRGDVSVPAGWQCWLRVTTLSETVFQPFIQRFLRGGARPQVQVGPLACGVSEVLTTPGAHAWAGCVDADDLLAQAEPVERLKLEFASPTTFNLGRDPGSSPHYALFPHPALVFGSLASKWREVISPELEVAYIEDIAAEARVSEYRLQTQNLRWRGYIQKGFIGTCLYDLRDMAAYDRAWLCALADFAFYAGVGGKTPQGMGQCRRLVERTREE